MQYKKPHLTYIACSQFLPRCREGDHRKLGSKGTGLINHHTRGIKQRTEGRRGGNKAERCSHKDKSTGETVLDVFQHFAQLLRL